MSFSSMLLKSNIIREKVITNLKSDYFNELNISIPVSNGYSANLFENDSYDSFSEIFIQEEYKQFLPEIDIRKVIDVGANYGYFSLWLQSLQPAMPIKSLMIEASPRCRSSLDRLTSDKRLKRNFSYLPKAIGNPDINELPFYDRPFMAGSIFEDADCLSKSYIPILKNDEISEILTPPYDLIKCDIEGAEWDFLTYYEPVIKSSHFTVIEWHSWHKGGKGFPQIEQRMVDLGFEITHSNAPQKAIGRDGEVGLFLAKNLNFQN